MSIGDIIALLGFGAVSLGLILTWRRNSREMQERDRQQVITLTQWKTEIKGSVDHINGELKSEDHGLNALSNKINGFQTHCAEVSTRHAEQIAQNTKDIDEIKAGSGERRH